MAQESNSREDIKEIQRFLRGVSKRNENIPQVVSDGIYGPETEAAVIAFQKEAGLPQTGEVDGRTWEALFKAYEAVLKEYSAPVRIDPFPARNGAMHFGDTGTVVYMLQTMLDFLADNYYNIPHVGVTGKFDTDTEDAVLAFQKRSLLNRSGSVDRDTWDMLAKTFNAGMRNNHNGG